MKMAASPQVYMRRCPKTVFIPSASQKPQSESVDSLCGFLHGNEDENGKRASSFKIAAKPLPHPLSLKAGMSS